MFIVIYSWLLYSIPTRQEHGWPHLSSDKNAESPISHCVLCACVYVMSLGAYSDGHFCLVLDTHGAAHWAEAIQLSVLPQNIC